MKLAISNIAWQKEEEKEIAKLLVAKGVDGVEIAPSKIGSVSPDVLKDADILEYKHFWNNEGLKIVAMQALLFGRSDLTIFESENSRKNLLVYLKRIIEIGSILGAKALIFGSPKNRKVGNLSTNEIEDIAIPFFKELGNYAKANNTYFCLEPNPHIYDCDFAVTTSEAISLVNKVNTPGFTTHIDTAAMTLNKEPLSIISENKNLVVHVHASEAYLNPVDSNKDVDHRAFLDVLKSIDYKGYISIEMKSVSNNNNISTVEKAIGFMNKQNREI
ncbi:MAG: sugar phosphate isomerase/epimerase family protein [Cytophagaceae bacterium]